MDRRDGHPLLQRIRRSERSGAPGPGARLTAEDVGGDEPENDDDDEEEERVLAGLTVSHSRADDNRLFSSKYMNDSTDDSDVFDRCPRRRAANGKRREGEAPPKNRS